MSLPRWPLGRIVVERDLALNLLAWLIFFAAAALEVAGDAVVRLGLRGHHVRWILLGGAALAGYGVVVNTVKWDFSKLLGVYVGVFALVSILFGKFVLREEIPSSTWLGLACIIVGGLIIQFGRGKTGVESASGPNRSQVVDTPTSRRGRHGVTPGSGTVTSVTSPVKARDFGDPDP